jgi:hypothetical protein
MCHPCIFGTGTPVYIFSLHKSEFIVGLANFPGSVLKFQLGQIFMTQMPVTQDHSVLEATAVV